jgi:hypothetical protein
MRVVEAAARAGIVAAPQPTILAAISLPTVVAAAVRSLIETGP